ncbi:MAG TPA: ABC transporter permease [Vicinamibacterales bacterium]|nr:ABC transporter permease [Vicinamibacterales bacterium]
METFLQDVRFGWRLLRRSPGFTIAAVLALALGVGATTAVFTLLDRVVLRPLPYPSPDRLTMMWETNDAKGLAHERLSPVNFMDYRGLSSVFEDAAAWWYPQLNLTEPGRDPMRVASIETSANFFSVLGVSPMIGSAFPSTPRLDAREPIIVISHRLWQQRFGADPGIVGRLVTLNGQPFTVIGVMAPGFRFPDATDVWQRLTWPLEQHSRGAHFMESIARLRPGATVDQANAELRALTTTLGRRFAATNGEWRARAVPLAHEVQGSFRPALFALFGAAALLLVITCTNVASLLLARATAREREVAVRAAMGASRSRLIRQFLTESVVLAALGTATGVAVAIAVERALVALSPVRLPRLDESGLGVDGRMLAFTCAVAALTAIAYGVVPALFMASSGARGRGDVEGALRQSGRGADGTARRHARSVLVVAEVALAVMLLVGAALLARGLQHLLRQDPGFEPSGGITISLELPYSYGDYRKIADFYAGLLTAIRSQPGVTAAGATTTLPLTATWRLPHLISGRAVPAPTDAPQAQTQIVDEEYFRTIAVPLLRGRFFEARDTADAPGVVLINDALARREFPGEDPIGQSMTSGVRNIGPMATLLMPPGTKFQIVGIVSDVKNQSLVREVEPTVYFTFRQFPFRELHLVVQGRGEPAKLVAVVRDSVQRMDANLPLGSAQTLQQVIGDAIDQPRALMLLMGVFAAMALVLAALGIYSVLSFAVGQRRREISLRLALGAQPRDVVWLVVRDGLLLAVIGAGVGAAGAMALGRTLASLLNGVSSADGVAFVVATAVAIVAAVAACLPPARRAANLDPLAGLRAE